jgi:hypothetical protein
MEISQSFSDDSPGLGEAPGAQRQHRDNPQQDQLPETHRY